MKKYQVNYYTKGFLSYFIVNAETQDEVISTQYFKETIKNHLQIHSIEEYWGPDDIYEPCFEDFEDKTSVKFFGSTNPEGDSILNHLKYSSSFELDKIYDQKVNAESILEFNNQEQRKIGAIMCVLHAPHLNCDDYRFEYTMVSPNFLQYDKNKVKKIVEDMHENNTKEFNKISEWLKDTRTNPVFLVEGNSFYAAHGERNMLVASYFEEPFVSVFIAHKIKE